MAQVKLELKGLDADGVTGKGDALNTAMKGNPNFPDATSLLASLTAHNADAKLTIVAQKNGAKAAIQTTTARDMALDLVKQDIVAIGAHVQSVSKGNPAIIQTSGLGTKAAGSPIGKLGQVQNFSLTTGDKPGESDGHWDAVFGNKLYQHARCLTDPTVEANWQNMTTSGASRTTFTDQASGSRVWWRVRANAPKSVNNGPWSQPASIIVP